MHLNNNVKNIPEALSIYINQIANDLAIKGHKVIKLSKGEAFFNLPVYDFSKLDANTFFHYSDARGIIELRKCICNYYKKYKANVLPNEILISAGSKAIIYMAIKAIISNNDEVLSQEPSWLSYKEQVILSNGSFRSIPYDIKINNLQKFFSKKTKIFILNNPLNPSGRVYKKNEIKYIYNLCKKNNVFLIVDEVYSDFVQKGFYSGTKLSKKRENLVVVNSLSKNMGMSGWRVGYCIANQELLNLILKLNQHIINCAPTILQQYMAKYFFNITKETLPQINELIKKRERIKKNLQSLDLKFMEGKSTFYFMIDIEDFPGNALDFSMYLLLFYKISVVPGFAYGKSCKRFIRVSVGTESEEKINEALLAIKILINKKKINKAELENAINKEKINKFIYNDR